MSKRNGAKPKRDVLDYGMEWFDYHLTAGLYISVIISALIFIFVFIGQYYRPKIYTAYPAIRVIDNFMSIYYLAYTVVVFLTRKIFFAEDKRSFTMFLILFAVRVIAHAIIIAYLLVFTSGVIATSIFYKYIFYFSVCIVAINIFNIIYFIRRKGIFDYN